MKLPEFREFVAKDLALLSCVGMRMLLVHGGGPEINSWLAKINVEPKFLNGLWVTDELTMEVVEMVLVGKANNFNADTAAGEIAAAVGAEKLILLTDVARILEDRNDPSSLIKEINISGIQKMTEEGKVAGGMIPKVECCIKSLTKGVDKRCKHSKYH